MPIKLPPGPVPKRPESDQGVTGLPLIALHTNNPHCVCVRACVRDRMKGVPVKKGRLLCVDAKALLMIKGSKSPFASRSFSRMNASPGRREREGGLGGGS